MTHREFFGLLAFSFGYTAYACGVIVAAVAFAGGGFCGA